MNGTTRSSVGSPGAQGETSLLDQRDLHRLCSSDVRRSTLDVLVDSEAPLTLRELGGRVAEREQIGDSVEDGIDRVTLVLHHNHLPRIDGAGLVQYDSESNRVDVIYQDLIEQILEGRF